MKNQIFITLFLISSLLGCTKKIDQTLPLVPGATMFDLQSGNTSLSQGFSFQIESKSLAPLAQIFNDDFYLLTGIKNENSKQLQPIQLLIDETLTDEAYEMHVGEKVLIKGGSYSAVSMGLISLLQLMNKSLEVPKVVLRDSPELEYRSLMIDVARGWHEMSVLKEIITLCKWYKVNYLHLHLTDDQSFTFPSTAYPQLATEGRSFTLLELKELNQYAIERGVTLVPEIDVPGHSTQFVRKMPALFGIGDPGKNSYTISMGKEEVYEALETIIGEIAEAFPYSPYIHIGGDEAFFTGMEDDPETIAYLKKHDLPNLDELFRHFLVRLNEMVKSKGKQTIAWAGFGEEGEVEIPKDIIVMLWEGQYFEPKKLLDQGYSIINASFKPLYVVNNRKWDADYIYTQWNPNRFESWATEPDIYRGIELPENDQVLGATMCVWEQNQINQIHRLTKRLPAMVEHLWNPKVSDIESFHANLASTNRGFQRLLRPFEVETTGRTYPEMDEGNFYEHLWFSERLRLSTSTNFEGISLRYTTDGTDVKPTSKPVEAVMEFTNTTTVKIQAFDESNHPIGQPYHQRFFLKPIKVETNALWKDLPPGSWEKLRFEDQMTIELKTSFDDLDLRYTTDGSPPKSTSDQYQEPITIDKTTRVRAQLFDKAGEPFGSGFSETYYVIVNEPSLTTGKPTIASNEHLTPGRTSLATNGRITLWEMWGGHVDDHVWIKVDLEKIESISKLKVYTFWDNYRYYQYTIDGSINGETWTQLVDFSENTTMSSIVGYEHLVDPTEVRFIRINMLYNSANPGLHLVELGAFH